MFMLAGHLLVIAYSLNENSYIINIFCLEEQFFCASVPLQSNLLAKAAAQTHSLIL